MTQQNRFISLLAFLIVCTVGYVQAKTTVLVYIAADNNLAPEALYNIAQMQAVGSTNNISILAHLNTKLSNGKKVSRKLYITKNGSTQIGPDEVLDSGSGATLLNACSWALTDYPSDQFVLILWNHGSGPLNRINTLSSLEESIHWWEQDIIGDRGVCYDDTTGSYLTDRTLNDVLNIVVQTYRGGKKINIIAFDACLMAGIEIAETLAPYANYVVASQETVPGSGFNYTGVLEQPAKSPLSDKDFALGMINAYQKEYAYKVNDYTLSAIDSSLVKNVTENNNAIATTLLQGLASPDARVVKLMMQKSVALTMVFQDPTYVDLGILYKNMLLYTKAFGFQNNALKQQLITQLNNGIAFIGKAVVTNVNGYFHNGATGLSIYFPKQGPIEPSYPKLLWSQKNKWGSMLSRLYA